MKKRSVFTIMSALVGVSALVACNPQTSGGTGSSSSGGAPVGGLTASSYVAATYAEKADILEQLEKYTIDNNISGVPYYENSSYVLYNDRIQGLFEKEIPLLGWGGSYSTITTPMAAEANPDYKLYWHTWTSSLPSVLNAWNSQGSDVSDDWSYFNDVYFDMRPNAAKNGYEWVPSLAKGKPVAENANANTGLATKWRIEVRKDVKYDTLSSDPAISAYKGRDIELQDYLTPFITTLLGNNGQFRAADLADPGVGGVVGAAAFTSATKGLDQLADAAAIATAFEQVGIKATEENGHWYLDFEFLTPCNQFNAIYRLYNPNYGPLPSAFFQTLRTKAGQAVGTPAVNLYGQNVDSVLSTGAYTLKEWQADKLLTFAKNTSFHDASLYNLAGYHQQVISSSTASSAAFSLFLNGGLDSVAVPTESVTQYKSDPRAKIVSGNVVTKLNNNSATPELWDELFGPDGSIAPHTKVVDWSSKAPDTDINPNGAFIPANRYVLSNDAFMKGLYFSINRAEYADSKGRTPSQGYLAAAYMIDPENGISWRDSDQGKAVFDDYSPDTYGYSPSLAEDYFGQAADEIVTNSNGTWKDGDTITLNVFWRTADEATQSQDIENYFTTAWNQSSAKTTHNISLAFNQISTADYNDAYDAMQRGETDFGAGAITGNQLDPLSFMNVASTSNSSGFTLSWGGDTRVPGGAKGPIEYDGKTWSYDGLYQAASTGAVLDEAGSVVDLFVADIKSITLADSTASASFTFTTPVVDGVDVTFDGVVMYSYQTGDVIPGSSFALDGEPTSEVIGNVTWLTYTVSGTFPVIGDDALGYNGDGTGDSYFDFEVHYTVTIAEVSVSTFYDIAPVPLSIEA